jgi:hypothetical protein
LAISAKLSAVFMAAVSSAEPAKFMASQLKNIYYIKNFLRNFYFKSEKSYNLYYCLSDQNPNLPRTKKGLSSISCFEDLKKPS